jgi:hypothetical protein
MVFISTHDAQISFENQRHKIHWHSRFCYQVTTGKTAETPVLGNVCKQFGALKAELGLNTLDMCIHHRVRGQYAH